MDKRATISDCGTYRYRLVRAWGVGTRALFIMLNPSTADAKEDDPTIRRCIGFAKRWDYAGITVVNMYAYRATKPADLWRAARDGVDIVGPDNTAHITTALDAGNTGMVVAAWGSIVDSPEARVIAGRQSPKVRSREIVDLALAAGQKVFCIGLSAKGNPRHPLMLSYRAALEPYAP